jgi:hypothetical protein
MSIINNLFALKTIPLADFIFTNWIEPYVLYRYVQFLIRLHERKGVFFLTP